MSSPPELDQAGKLGGLDALLERRVERPAECDVHRPLAELHALRPHEGGNVPEAHGADAAAFDRRPRVETAGRHVDHDVILAFSPLDEPLVERPGHERDRPVAARGRVAGVVEEDDAEIGRRVVRLDDEAAVHVRMAARLVDEKAAYVVEPLESVAPLVQDRRATRRLDAARDDPERLPGSVVVDRANLHSGDPRQAGAPRIRRRAWTPSAP